MIDCAGLDGTVDELAECACGELPAQSLAGHSASHSIGRPLPNSCFLVPAATECRALHYYIGSGGTTAVALLSLGSAAGQGSLGTFTTVVGCLALTVYPIPRNDKN
ncbi:hypothetical protein Ddc_07820 [Ditylenchus destructor]|nr:hypothetical protein Ddc_07820 [Ditylenchus destructor]